MRRLKVRDIERLENTSFAHAGGAPVGGEANAVPIPTIDHCTNMFTEECLGSYTCGCNICVNDTECCILAPLAREVR